MSTPEHMLRVRRLYKLIFRVHRALPPELRIMGDNYARDEFKRHKKCNPEEARIFMNEWTGKTPETWSGGEVVLFFKKGDNTLLKNYRPITLL